MNRLRTWLVVLVLVGAGLPLSRAHAAASHDACTTMVTQLPVHLAAPGTYCLAGDLRLLQPWEIPGQCEYGCKAIPYAVTVSNDVVLDCGGHTLAARASIGVYGYGDDVTVRNCRITEAGDGIFLHGDRARIEGNSIPDAQSLGISLDGQDLLVRDNRVTGAVDFGIVTSGRVVLEDNLVAGVGPSQNAATVGILVRSSPGGEVRGNRIRGIRPNATGTATGLQVTSNDRLVLIDNRITGDGGARTTGIRCAGTRTQLRDNLVAGVATPLANCGDTGNNGVSP